MREDFGLIFRIAAVLVLALGVLPAKAQTYTTMPLGNGCTVTNGPDGDSATTMPLGNGWTATNDNRGGSATRMPLGNGFYSTTVTPPPDSADDDE
jgi:hypothetical protein